MLASVLDVHKILFKHINNNLLQSCDSKIDFAPSKMLKGDKTTGWIASDHMKVMKLLPWIFRNHNSIVKEKFDNSDFNIKDYNTKICTAFLKLCNQKFLES